MNTYYKNVISNKRTLRAIALFAAPLFLVLSALGGPGSLDRTFGTGGFVSTPMAGGIGTYFAYGTAIQSDGKIIAVGEGWIGNGPGTTWDFAVVRYNTNGSMDTSFGRRGIVLTAVGDSHDGAFAVAIQEDSKIVAAGYSYDDGFAVVRYNTDGSLDTSFSGTGIVTTQVGGYPSSLAIQSDGKIVVAGSVGNASNHDFVVIRYNADGSLDTSFNGTGIVITSIGNSHDRANSVAIQPDGKIVVTGSSYNETTGSSFATVRYRTNGLLDNSFHATGKVITPFGNGFSGAGDLAIQLDGKIVVAGYSDLYPNGDFAIVRYNTSGLLDTSFGSEGREIIPVGNSHDYANSVVIQRDGKIVAAGSAYYDMAVVRVNSNGSLDTTFNGTGKIITPTWGNDASSVAIQEDGKIVVAGGQNDEIFGFMLVRYQGGPVNGKIAFTSDRDGDQEIYVVNDDGTGQRRLTNNSGADSYPAFSPDGRKIAFVSQTAAGSFVIKLMNADGSDQTDVTPIDFVNSPSPWLESDFSLSWSPDGRKIAFEEMNEIFTVNIDGTERTNLTNNVANDWSPSWSPDGSRILFVSSRETYWAMYTMKPDGSDVRALPGTDPYLWDTSPSWEPAGNKIAFVAAGEDGPSIIMTADADGTNRQLFDNTVVLGYYGARNNPRWSSDGKKIAFQIAFGGDTELFTKNVNGTGFRQLTVTSGRNYQPSWQPRKPQISPISTGTSVE